MNEDIYKAVANELGMPVSIVRDAYKAFWLHIKEKAEALPLKMELNEEEFKKLRTSFNVSGLGKLACTWDRYKRVRKRFKYMQEIRKSNDKCEESETAV